MHSYFQHGGLHLFHCITKERVRLGDAAGHNGLLGFDASGFAFFTLLGKTEWAQHMLLQTLVVDESSSYAIATDDSAISLHDAVSAYTSRLVPVGKGKKVGIASVFLFDMGQMSRLVGACVPLGSHRNLRPSLRLAVKLGPLVHQKWDKLGLRSPHFRPGLKSPKACALTIGNRSFEVDLRCLPEASCSIAGLLALFVQASQEGPRKDKEQVHQWRSAFESLFDELLPEQLSARIFMKASFDVDTVEYACDAPPPPHGSVRVSG